MGRLPRRVRFLQHGELGRDELHDGSVRLGFATVVNAFPRLVGDEAPIKFYDETTVTTSMPQGLVLTDQLSISFARGGGAGQRPAAISEPFLPR